RDGARGADGGGPLRRLAPPAARPPVGHRRGAGAGGSPILEGDPWPPARAVDDPLLAPEPTAAPAAETALPPDLAGLPPAPRRPLPLPRRGRAGEAARRPAHLPGREVLGGLRRADDHRRDQGDHLRPGLPAAPGPRAQLLRARPVCPGLPAR